MNAKIKRQPFVIGADEQNVEKIVVGAGAHIAQVQGFSFDIKCAAAFTTKGSHRPQIAEMLGDAKFDEAALRALAELDQSVEEVTNGIVILSTTILHVRRSQNVAHCDPFHKKFPTGWSMGWLPPQFRIQHLSLNVWAGIAPQLAAHDQAESFVDVWCGTPHFDHDDGKHATLFKFAQDDSCGGLVLKPENRCEKPFLTPNGYVAFGIYEIG